MPDRPPLPPHALEAATKAWVAEIGTGRARLEAAVSASLSACSDRDLAQMEPALVQMGDGTRLRVAAAIRDWIHEQPFSQCNASVDICPDWPLAYELADLVLRAALGAEQSEDA